MWRCDCASILVDEANSDVDNDRDPGCWLFALRRGDLATVFEALIRQDVTLKGTFPITVREAFENKLQRKRE